MLEFTEVQIINLIEMCSPLRFEEGTLRNRLQVLLG